MGKLIDLTGQQFGSLTVIKRAQENDNSGHPLWECQCECGNITTVRGSRLRNGNTKSCGCLRSTSKIIDIKGQKFGKLTALEFSHSDSDRHSMWKCRCDCGNEVVVRGSDLRSGKVKSCGCSKRVDLTGKRFGKLVAIKPTEQRAINNTVLWECKCDCGNIVYIPSSQLTKKDYDKSCGCLKYRDLTNQCFGQLTALRPIGTNGNRGISWECLCDCGNLVVRTESSLVSTSYSSCGCISSIGEKTINNLLTKNNISFKQEYTFDDLKDKKNLRFDFAVFDNNNNLQYLIEFDGEQHFAMSGWNDLANYEKVKLHDQMKNDYCKEHNIPLIRIPYTQRDIMTIEDLVLETSNFLVY